MATGRLIRAAALALAALLLGTAAHGREAARRSVLDYYLMLPPGAEIPAASQQERLAAIEKKALRHGYLRWRAGDVESTEMKLLRLSDGTPLIVLAHTGCCCKGACIRRIRFLADRDGGLVDVTTAVWKDLSPEDKRKAIEQRLREKDRWMSDRMADMAVYRLPVETAAVFLESDGRVFLRFRLERDTFVRY